MLTLLLACQPASLTEEAAVDTDTNTDTDTGTDTDTDTEPESLLSWRTHDTIGSLLYVTWEQDSAASGAVEYSFDEGDWRSTPSRAFDVGPQEELLLGIPYDVEVQIRLVTDALTSDTITAETDNHPAGLPIPEYVSGDPDRWLPEGRYLYTSINGSTGGWTSGDYWKVILDRQARVVWAMKTPDGHWTIWNRVSYDGDDLMWDESTVWVWGSSAVSQVHRMKIDGQIVASYETPGLHHAWDELADGSLIWGHIVGNNEETLDKLSPDGATETLWRCSDFEVEQLGQTGYSCHSNSWWWHEETDTFIVSFPSSAGRVRDTVLHMDHEGRTLHTWGRVSEWTFSDEQTTFDYQHGVTFTPEGNLLLSTKMHESNPYYDRSLDTLAVREYSLDYEAKTLTEVFSFGEDQGIAGNTAGEAHRLSNGSTLHNYGSGARTREITADGELVWDIKWSGGDSEGSGRLQGRSVFLADLYDFAP